MCHVRPARRRARPVAVAEALGLLRDLGAKPMAGGPGAEQPGVFWVALPAGAIDRAAARLPALGYTGRVERAIEAPDAAGRPGSVRWRRRWHVLEVVRADDAQSVRDEAPDRREFLLEGAGGERRLVRGYRGSSAPGRRRGLPAVDARMLVNLVYSPAGPFLDPFAGAGGIVREALRAGLDALSADIDPAMRLGLLRLGACHAVADARALPFADRSVAAIATEPPYDPDSDRAVVAALAEMARVLEGGGRLAVYCASRQAPAFRDAAAARGLVAFVDAPVDRKGTPCHVLAWSV